MDVSKDWLGKAAGWRAFQEGRKLHAAGRVLECSRDGELFVGVLQASPRPRKVQVKIISANEVETRCTCAENRRDGAFCGHGVALVLESIEGSIKTPEPANTSTSKQSAPRPSRPSRRESRGNAYQVKIRSCALEALHRSRPLSFSIERIKGEPDENDLNLSQWMSSLHLGSDEDFPLLQVQGPQLESLIEALSGHERVLIGEKALRISLNQRKPELEFSPPSQLQCPDPGEHWLKIGSQWWWITPELWQAGPRTSGKFDALIDGEAVEVKELELLSGLDDLGADFELVGDAFDSLEFSTQIPHLIINLEGSGGYIEAHPQAIYEGREAVDLLDFDATPHWKPADQKAAEWGTFHTRDLSLEQEVIEFLSSCGFQKDKGEPTMRLRGEEPVIDFLAGDLQRMQAHGWEVVPSVTLSKILSKIEVISPSISQTQSGGDWLDLEISYPGSSGQNFTQQQVRQVLSSGRKKFKLPNGKLGIIDQSACETLETLLAETDPKQIRGNQYRVDARHVESLHRALGEVSPTSIQSEMKWVDKVQAQLEYPLRDYQKHGVAWMLSHCRAFGGALLADDMGLGKTFQSIALILAARSAGVSDGANPVLVVAPTSLLTNWEEEIARFAPKLRCLIWHGSNRDDYRQDIAKSDVVLTSYGVLTRDRVLFRKSEWSLAFLDEASLIRNPEAEIAKSCHAIQAQCRIAITGTPVENSVRDLWSCFQFILPGYFGKRKEFEERYEKPCRETPPDPKALQRLQLRVEPHLLRRRKDEVATELPAKIETVVWCGMSRTQADLYRTLINQGHEAIAQASKTQGAGAAKLQTLTTLLRLRQCCCDVRLTGLDSDQKLDLKERSSKLLRLIEIISDLRNNNHKALIFSQFTSQLDNVSELLDALGHDYCRLDGSSRDRGGIVRKFQSENGPGIFLISLKAGGYGLNLTQADVVIHLDPWWNPAAERQATDRAHRIGQLKPVNVYKLITRGTVEEKILRLQQSKAKLAGGAIGETLEDGPGSMDLDFDELTTFSG